jgi:GT2 family glycosyltransferase
MKNVLIAIPCLYGKVDAWFVNSLYESVLLGLQNNILIKPVFLANESILPMARNELLNLAYQQKYDSMVFIDDDEEWDENVLIDIIQSDKDVVAVPVVNKNDQKIEYNIFGVDKSHDLKDGYVKIDRCGTGFLKLSSKVINDLWENSSYCEFRGKKLKYICEYKNIDNSFYGEDIVLCEKIKNLGYQIWANPRHTVSHIGNKKYEGNFMQDFQIKYT